MVTVIKSDKIIKILVAVSAVCILSLLTFKINGVTRSVSDIPEPVQTETSGSAVMQVDDWNMTINYKAKYRIEALVVHTKNYSFSEPGDKLSPRDLALAWGNVAENNKDIDFNWGQSGRWYSWKLSSYDDADRVGGVDYINQHSANCHIIPADDTVKKQLKSVKKGDHILIEGYLVYVSGTNSDGDTFNWESSLSRNDTGDGACEVIYTTDITEIT